MDKVDNAKAADVAAPQTKDAPQTKEKVFIERVVSINRVAKVTKGGKTLGFAALVVVGDGIESVGFALGKANEVAEAIRKGIKKAKKELISVAKKDTTIPHETRGKFGAVEVLLKPALRGTGVIASSPVRAICECLGVHDILTKVLKKSTNPVNVVKATFCALESLKGKDESITTYTSNKE